MGLDDFLLAEISGYTGFPFSHTGKWGWDMIKIAEVKGGSGL